MNILYFNHNNSADKEEQYSFWIFFVSFGWTIKTLTANQSTFNFQVDANIIIVFVLG